MRLRNQRLNFQSPPPDKEAEPPLKVETPSQLLPKPSDPQPEAEPVATQPVPSEIPAEAEIQESTESVGDCIAYRKEHAINISLALDNTAVECWDTPITSSDSYYFKRDITYRLNRYKECEDITDIWI